MEPNTEPVSNTSDLPLVPRVPALAGVLTNQAIVELYRLPGPVTTQLMVSVAARVANEGGWRGYRGGRQRLAGWIGVYANWMTPGPQWRFEPLVALDQVWPSWRADNLWFADIAAPDQLEYLDTAGLAEIAHDLLEEHPLDAVRVLTLSAPLASRVFAPDGPARGTTIGDSKLAEAVVA